MRDFNQMIRYYSHKCLTVLILSNNNNIINNCLRGMHLKDIFRKTSFNNVNKLQIKKTIYLERNTIDVKTTDDVDIKQHTMSELMNYRYDLLIIDTEKSITSYLDNFKSKINCYILVNKPKIKQLNDWKTKNYNAFTVFIKDNKSLFNKSCIKNYNNTYKILKKIIDILDKHKIVYRLCGYDCLTGYIYNAHSIFTDTIELCIHHSYNLKDILNKYKIPIQERGVGFLLIKCDEIDIKISLYKTSPINETPRKFLFIENSDISFNIDDAGSMPTPKSFGPIKVDTFKNPLPYLIKRFGTDFLNNIHYPLLEEKIYDSSILYTDCADFYSHNRSDIWRKELVNAGKEVAQLLSNAGIKYWLDGGSLLGAIRNGDIPLGDDDIDLGVFTYDLNKIYNLKLPDNMHITGKANNGCVIRKNNNGILYDIEILAHFKNKDKNYQCNRFSDTRNMKNRAYKCAIPSKYFDNLETIKLGNYSFPCPQSPSIYVELPQKYGINAIETDPQPHKKSGNQDWINFGGRSCPSLRY